MDTLTSFTIHKLNSRVRETLGFQPNKKFGSFVGEHLTKVSTLAN